MSAEPRISVVVPVLNEAPRIVATLSAIQAMRRAGHEVIVVDGGSQDRTAELADPLADRVLYCTSGRARQMNAGAAVASGAVLWFLHADTLAGETPDEHMLSALAGGRRAWGRFDVRLSGRRPALRVIEACMNLRSRVSGIATGDQGIFVERDAFARVGGFPDQPLMEDIELCRRLKRIGRPACLRATVRTSSRRWEHYGIARTVLLMWRLRLAYFLGADPDRLWRRYRLTDG